MIRCCDDDVMFFHGFCCNMSLVSLSGRAELPQKQVFRYLENELLDEPLGIHFGVGPASQNWVGISLDVEDENHQIKCIQY